MHKEEKKDKGREGSKKDREPEGDFSSNGICLSQI